MAGEDCKVCAMGHATWWHMQMKRKWHEEQKIIALLATPHSSHLINNSINLLLSLSFLLRRNPFLTSHFLISVYLLSVSFLGPSRVAPPLVGQAAVAGPGRNRARAAASCRRHCYGRGHCPPLLCQDFRSSRCTRISRHFNWVRTILFYTLLNCKQSMRKWVVLVYVILFAKTNVVPTTVMVRREWNILIEITFRAWLGPKWILIYWFIATWPRTGSRLWDKRPNILSLESIHTTKYISLNFIKDRFLPE